MSKPRQLETRKKIAFSDCDPFRHLNNARYLDYFLDTREEQVEEAYGISLIEWASRGRGWLVQQNQIAYLRPANYREEVILISRVIRFSATQLQVEMLMTDSSRSHLKALLWTTLTHISIPESRKQEHPPEFMQLLEEIVYPEEGMETAFFEKRLQQIKAARLHKQQLNKILHMEEPFLLTVSYKGHDQDYEAQLQLRGYSYQIRVLVNCVDVLYERDEEGAFRAILSANAVAKETKVAEPGLLQAIAQKIEAVLA